MSLTLQGQSFFPHPLGTSEEKQADAPQSLEEREEKVVP